MYFFVTMAYIHTDLPKPKNNFTYNTTKKNNFKKSFSFIHFLKSLQIKKEE